MSVDNQPPTEKQVSAEIDKNSVKPQIGIFVRIVGCLILVGILGIGIGVYEAWQHHMIPGLNQDENKVEGVIGPETLVSMPQSEINKLYPDAFAKVELQNKKTIITPYTTYVVGDNISTLQVQYPFDLSTSVKPNANLSFTKDLWCTGLILKELTAFKEKGYYNIIEFKNVPYSTIINSPVDGMLTLVRFDDVPNPSNGADINAAWVEFVAPNGNHYRIVISGEITKKRTSFVFKSLTNSPSLSIKNTVDGKPINTTSNPIEIKKGEPIMEVINAQGSEIDIGFSLAIAQEGETGEGLNMGNPRIPTNIEFLTTQDGKLLVPSGK